MKWVLISFAAIAVTLADETSELKIQTSANPKQELSDKSLYSKSALEDYTLLQGGAGSENVFYPDTFGASYTGLNNLKGLVSFDGSAISKTIDKSAKKDNVDADVTSSTASSNTNELVDTKLSNAGPGLAAFSNFDTFTNIPVFKTDNSESNTVAYNGETNVYGNPKPGTTFKLTKIVEKPGSTKETRVFGAGEILSLPNYSAYSDLSANLGGFNLPSREFLYYSSPIFNQNIDRTVVSNAVADKPAASDAANKPTVPTTSVPEDGVEISTPEITKPTSTKIDSVDTSIPKTKNPFFWQYAPGSRQIVFSPHVVSYDPQLISSSSFPTFSYPLFGSIHGSPLGGSIGSPIGPSIDSPLVGISPPTSIPSFGPSIPSFGPSIPSFGPSIPPASEIVIGNGPGSIIPPQSGQLTNPSFNPALSPSESVTISADSISVSALNLSSPLNTTAVNPLPEFSQSLTVEKNVETISTDPKLKPTESSDPKKNEQDTSNIVVNTEGKPLTPTGTTPVLAPAPLLLGNPFANSLYGSNLFLDSSQASLLLDSNNQGINQNYFNGINSFGTVSPYYNTFPSYSFGTDALFKKKRSS